MEKKERLKPLSLYGYDLKEEQSALFSQLIQGRSEKKEKNRNFQRKPRETKKERKSIAEDYFFTITLG